MIQKCVSTDLSKQKDMPIEIADSLDLTLIEHKLDTNDINHFKDKNGQEDKDQNTVDLTNNDILETEMTRNFDDVNNPCSSNISKSKEDISSS